ncbi:hypothetical protein [Halotia branconii]|uniref:Uncharacterized protein n=1 Tax=Halotia branconii CENA392 TaxID=1539056 RepID=A0AAJ6PC58_9CYAN|nr:hypothetical protein [Halotia branconii]WGV28560.1 hypothetical protein QI031_14335 [Halotia branconii CENA392]
MTESNKKINQFDLDLNDIFLPRFIFIDLPDAIPGGILPNGGKEIIFDGQTITPLLPLNPILLDYFTAEELVKLVQFQLINDSEESKVRVVFDLLASDLQYVTLPHNSCFIKDYEIKEENALREVPVLEVWPNFRVEGWKEYYFFYCDSEFGEETFQVSLPDIQEVHVFQYGLGSYQIVRLEEFPSHIICQDSARNTIGLILLKTPEKIQATWTWKIGVNFGQSFTNVYVNRNNIVEPLPLQQLHLKVTDSDACNRLPVLFEYFIPESFIPSEKPLPLENILTTRGKRDVSLENSRPVLDARFYFPDKGKFKLEEDWIETNVNLGNFTLAKLFLQHLSLHITAMAAKRGVGEIQWCLSYPSKISLFDKRKYLKIWQDLIQDLQRKTGIKHICPTISDSSNFRSESLAFGQYFADREDHNLICSTCICIGDLNSNISDISVWENNQIIHQCSLKFSEQDLFSNFLKLNPQFLEQTLEVKQTDWRGLEQENFYAKLNVFMRWESEKWLKNKRAFVEEEADFQGLIRLIAIGTAGLYYYIGILLKALQIRGKLQRKEITPVYVGGRGSRLLHWLAIEGQFNRNSKLNLLLSRMLSKGSGFPDTEEITRLSKRPKDEIACGLVEDTSRLQELMEKDKKILIAGENCQVNGSKISWDSLFKLEKNIEYFQIDNLEHLKMFYKEFNLALGELEIDGLTPLPGYQPVQGAEANQRLWQNIHKELTGLMPNANKDFSNIMMEPPFILGLKALLRVLTKEWVET